MADALTGPLNVLVALARPGSEGKARDALAPFHGRVAREIVIVTDIGALVSARPALVVEAAGHEAVGAWGAALLERGVDFLITSAGALADARLRTALADAAQRGNATWDICAGAVGGLDILAAACLSGIDEVTYTSRKPPHAWRDTPAERLIDLSGIERATTFYEGSAEAAARDYPQNANVAATIALKGAGFEKTRVRLMADPGIDRNVHEIIIHSACADVEIRISGRPSPDNPKTSLTTGYALAADIIARLASQSART
jgi:aspartate dehydrogenase